ncbi:MAG: hypothetical protein WBL21_11655 [Salinimicrobium sp.]
MALKIKPYKKFLPLVTAILLVANVMVYGYFGDYESGIMRFISMVVFFAFFLSPRYYKKSALIIFAVFVFNDLLLIYYEDFINQNIVLFIRLFAYLLMARLVLPYLKKVKIHLFEGIFIGAILILNLLLLYSVQGVINAGKNAGWLGELLVYGYGTATIILVCAAFTFYSRYFDKASIFFLLAVIGLVMSDLTYFIGFYLEFYEFYYLDRVFNILAIGFFLHFLFLFKRKVASGFYDRTLEEI